MKREAILKIMLVLIIGVMLFAKPINVFATSNNPTNLYDEFFEDQGSLGDIQKEDKDKETTTTPSTQTQTPSTTTKPSTDTTTTTKPNTQTQTSTNKDKELPKAGLVEDTLMIVTILAFIAIAVFTFVKISDYSNI